MKSLIIDTCVEMINDGEVDKIIDFLKKKHRHIELGKAKHDKKLLVAVADVVKSGHHISPIPVMHELKSIEVVKDIYAIAETKYLKEVKSND